MKRLLCLLFVLASGCGGDAGKGSEGREIADGYQDALDKASEVEKKLEDAKSGIDQAVDELDDDD